MSIDGRMLIVFACPICKQLHHLSILAMLLKAPTCKSAADKYCTSSFRASQRILGRLGSALVSMLALSTKSRIQVELLERLEKFRRIFPRVATSG